MGDNESRVVRVGLRQTWGGILLALGMVTFLSLLTYNWEDISALKVPVDESPHNCFGQAGAWLIYSLLGVFGLVSAMVPVWMGYFGLFLLFKPRQSFTTRVIWMVLVTFAAALLVELKPEMWQSYVARFNIAPAYGGTPAHYLTHRVLVPLVNPSGTAIIAVLIILLGVVRLVGIRALGAVYALIGGAFVRIMELIEERRERKTGTAVQPGLDEAVKKPKQVPGGRDLLPVEKEQDKGKPKTERNVVLEERAAKAMEEADRVRKERLAQEQKRQAELKRQRDDKPAQSVVVRTDRPQPQVERKPESVSDKKQTLDASTPKSGAPAADRKPAQEETPQSRLAAGPKLEYRKPPVTLLNELPPAKDRAIKSDVQTTSRVLEETLAEFGVEAKVVNTEQGPAVTRYELLPAPGVKVERIAALSNNLSLALKATSVRVQAPVPGKGVVGIEVPNIISCAVYVREMLEGAEWQEKEHTYALPLVLGKDVGGNDVISDLAAMPHLLVAGATGSGKTVCMNSILLGLLMARGPDELKLLLVDPKIVEFAAYNNLPHLVVPVITEPHKVTLGLRWAINEMEKRYKLFSKVGVRNIEGFNKRPKQADLFQMGGDQAEGDALPEKLPYIVIAVDELADLMLVAQADIENAIARLAQLSRAVGIHMILATQRPSVNVITGTIKANFPARIAFQVASKVDSRTILDENGADTLLGKGDMLFLPPGSSKLIRAQGAMVKDDEIKKVLEFIKNQSPPSYEVTIHEKIQSARSTESGGLDDGDDEMLEQAIQVLRETRRASTSSLQRRLRIGYTRAARLMDIMEERGIVGPPRGSDPREILIDLDGVVPDGGTEEDPQGSSN